MASAFQALPPPSPGVVYPTKVPNQPPSHSPGSFGTVFAVLAIILVISAVACVLGRLCNKRSQRSSSHQQQQQQQRGGNNKHPNHGRDPRLEHGDYSHGLPPNQSGRPRERDEEFGFGGEEMEFGKKIPKIKIVPREEGRGQMMPPPRNGESSMGSFMPRMMESPRNFL